MAEFAGRIGHLDGLESPWMNAGGVARSLEEIELMSKTGVGAVEAGSYTLLGRIGNKWNPDTQQLDRTVYYHNSETGETFNSFGMPNEGMDEVEAQIPEMKRIANAHGKKLIVNVAPVSADPVKESQELVERAYAAGADAVLLNAGCPNVYDADGGRHEILSYKPDALRAVLSGLRYVTQRYHPVFVRLSPYRNGHQMLMATQAVWQSRAVSAVFTPNTWLTPKPVGLNGETLMTVEADMVGRSGPAVADAAAEQTRLAVNYFGGTNIDVVSSSGIMNARELQRRLDLGAVAGAGTTFYYESQNGWREDTDRMLHDLAA